MPFLITRLYWYLAPSGSQSCASNPGAMERMGASIGHPVMAPQDLVQWGGKEGGMRWMLVLVFKTTMVPVIEPYDRPGASHKESYFRLYRLQR